MKLVNLSIKIFISIILVTFIVASTTENSAEMTSTVSSESELNHGIFLNNKVFKYKNAKKAVLTKTKAKTAAVAKNQVANKVAVKKAATTTSTNTNKVANTAAVKKQTPTYNSEKTINSDGPILHKCWVQYFKYAEVGGKKNLGFKENLQFYEQPKFFPNADLNTKKDGLWEYIRTKNSFFLHLFESMVSFTSSRHVRI